MAGFTRGPFGALHLPQPIWPAREDSQPLQRPDPRRSGGNERPADLVGEALSGLHEWPQRSESEPDDGDVPQKWQPGEEDLTGGALGPYCSLPRAAIDRFFKEHPKEKVPCRGFPEH